MQSALDMLQSMLTVLGALHFYPSSMLAFNISLKKATKQTEIFLTVRKNGVN